MDVDDVSSDYLVVTGADYATYDLLTMTMRLRHEMGPYGVEKRKHTGNPGGVVLIKASDVEDIPDPVKK